MKRMYVCVCVCIRWVGRYAGGCLLACLLSDFAVLCACQKIFIYISFTSFTSTSTAKERKQRERDRIIRQIATSVVLVCDKF